MSGEKGLDKEAMDSIFKKVKEGNERAWEQLIESCDKYMHKCAWNMLNRINLPEDRKAEWEQELYEAGMMGVVDAVKGFDVDKGYTFLTYAGTFITNEMRAELKILMSDGRTSGTEYFELLSEEDIEAMDDLTDVHHFDAGERTVQLLDILKLQTDENHTLSYEEIKKWLKIYRTMVMKVRVEKTESDNTMRDHLYSMIEAMNWNRDRDKARIRYKGYEEDLLEKRRAGKSGNNLRITDFSYVHLFDNEMLDQLIQTIALSDMLTKEDKEQLIRRILTTTSKYYKNPYWSYAMDHLTFASGKIGEKVDYSQTNVARNLQLLQQAMNQMVQVSFTFNGYSAKGELNQGKKRHLLSPYQIVKYHDRYYCIGLKMDGDPRIWQYRVDMMDDIQIRVDDADKPVHAVIAKHESNPLRIENWNANRYMAEHLYMGYDEPRNIKIKVRIKDNNYSILYDWFGKYYTVTSEACEDGYVIVRVKTSPKMIVPWAMQYADVVEVLDEEVRNEIRQKLEKMREKYMNPQNIESK